METLLLCAHILRSSPPVPSSLSITLLDVEEKIKETRGILEKRSSLVSLISRSDQFIRDNDRTGDSLAMIKLAADSLFELKFYEESLCYYEYLRKDRSGFAPDDFLGLLEEIGTLFHVAECLCLLGRFEKSLEEWSCTYNILLGRTQDEAHSSEDTFLLKILLASCLLGKARCKESQLLDAKDNSLILDGLSSCVDLLFQAWTVLAEEEQRGRDNTGRDFYVQAAFCIQKNILFHVSCHPSLLQTAKCKVHISNVLKGNPRYETSNMPCTLVHV